MAPLVAAPATAVVTPSVFVLLLPLSNTVSPERFVACLAPEKKWPSKQQNALEKGVLSEIVALNSVLSQLVVSNIEVVEDNADEQQAKTQEALFLERGFVALVESALHDVPLCGSCNGVSYSCSPPRPCLMWGAREELHAIAVTRSLGLSLHEKSIVFFASHPCLPLTFRQQGNGGVILRDVLKDNVGSRRAPPQKMGGHSPDHEQGWGRAWSQQASEYPP